MTTVTFQQLYAPYGAVRSSSGAAPTAFGYTGQQADSATGLDFYHARYYDPVAQQFVSADTANAGLNRYGYVGGNPTTMVDPSGHQYACPENECGGAPPTTTTTTTPTPTPTDPKKPDDNGDSNAQHGSCTDPYHTYKQCSDYYTWVHAATAARWNWLSSLRQDAGWALLGAAAALILAAAATIYVSRNILTIIAAVEDILGAVGYGIVGYQLLHDSTPQSNEASTDLQNEYQTGAAAVFSALNSLQGIVAAMAGLGWLGTTLEKAALEGVKAAATGGIMGVLIDLVIAAAEGAIGLAASAAAQLILAGAIGVKAEYDQNLNMDLGTWCGKHTDVCGKPPANSF